MPSLNSARAGALAGLVAGNSRSAAFWMVRMLRQSEKPPENRNADGSWPVWGKKILRSGRVAFARWLSEKLLTDPRFLMARGRDFSKNGGGRQDLIFKANVFLRACGGTILLFASAENV